VVFYFHSPTAQSSGITPAGAVLQMVQAQIIGSSSKESELSRVLPEVLVDDNVSEEWLDCCCGSQSTMRNKLYQLLLNKPMCDVRFPQVCKVRFQIQVKSKLRYFLVLRN